MDYNHKLEGLELMYYLMKRFDYTYIQAKNEMIRHKQDMSFLKELNIDDNNINLHIEGGCDND